MKYPNMLAAMTHACGKTASDLGRAFAPDSNNPCQSVTKYLTGRHRPTLPTAQRLCGILSEWAGRSVRPEDIFPNLAYNARVHRRDDEEIARILGKV